MMEAVLSNADHPEYGVATIPLPIPRNQYDHCVSLLEALEIGDASEADCRLDSLDSAWPVLNRLVCTKVNLDELDYLAKRLDSFTVGEFSQFQAMAEKLNLTSMKDLINLTFCCQQATVITDFTNLKEVGRDHYMNIHGGCASMEELEQLDGVETAVLLIEDNEGTITRYGVVYDNGMQLSQLYDGKHLPCYHYEADMTAVGILPLFSAGRSRRLTLVPIIQSLAQLEKNYGKEGCEIIQDNCQDTIFGGFAPNSQTAEVLSKALGSRTVLSGSVSRGKNDPSQSLQMMERALLTPDELKSIPKGSFIVMKTGTHPMRTRLQLFLNWGITFGEPYVVPERANRAVAYANRVDLERNLPQLSEPEEMDESRGYAVSSRGGIAHAPAQERAVKRGKQMKTFGKEER